MEDALLYAVFQIISSILFNGTILVLNNIELLVSIVCFILYKFLFFCSLNDKIYTENKFIIDFYKQTIDD